MQLSLFEGGGSGPARIALDEGSWLDYTPGALADHEALFARLAATMQWKTERRVMYEREVDVPRLFARAPEDGPLDPSLAQLRDLLAARYAASFDGVGVNYYRDGQDSVAWHRDKMPRDRETLVCILSLGAPRKFMLRPFGGGASRSFALGHGDLLVLGGWCQLHWEHCVPKQKFAAPRMSCMFRHVYAR